jgi:hypothetical protein
MNIDQLKIELMAEMDKNQLLGFDSFYQAMRACLDHDDFASRWDILDQPKLIGLVHIAKIMKIWR